MGLDQIDPGETVLLHNAVGVAITCWAQVESGLTLVFWAATQIPEFQVASRILHVPQSLNVRLKMVDVTVESAFSLGRFPRGLKDLNDPWPKIARDIRSVVKWRNKIAHYITDIDPAAPEGCKAFLAPSALNHSDQARGVFESGFRMTAEVVTTKSQAFSKLSKRIGAYYDQLPRVQTDS